MDDQALEGQSTVFATGAMLDIGKTARSNKRHPQVKMKARRINEMTIKQNYRLIKYDTGSGAPYRVGTGFSPR
jgi:hypothetical protein